MKVLTQENYEIIDTFDLTGIRFYTSIDSGSYVAPHWHDALEVVLLQEGDLVFLLEENQTVQLEQGQCIMISPNVIHATRCTHFNRAIVFQIPMSNLEQYIPDAGSRTYSIPDSSECAQIRTKVEKFRVILEKMQTLADLTPDGGWLMFNSLLFEALFCIYRDFSQERSKSQVSRREKKLEKLKDVLNYIDQHYNEPISLDEISKIAMFEPKYFCRFFKDTLGTTFLNYQNKVRLSKIYRDILETNDPISEILEKHGFTNYKKFRTMFREEFRMTPTEVRKRAVNHPENDVQNEDVFSS